MTHAAPLSRTIPFRAPVRVVICGEVNAGKSTVLNALLRQPLLPDNIGQDARPWITARFRTTPGLEVTRPDGNIRTLPASAPPETVAEALRGALQVIVHSPAPHLAGFELVELPLTTAEAVTEDDIDLVESADIMIWVTIASQAWRLTEKTILDRFAAVLPDHRLIVVSRGDKLRAEADREKLMTRIRRETEDLFDDGLFLDGSAALLAGAARSDSDWVRSGAPDLMDRIDALADLARPATMDSIDLDDGSPIDNLVDLATFRRLAEPEVFATPVAEPSPLPLLTEALTLLLPRLPQGTLAGLCHGDRCHPLAGTTDAVTATAQALRPALAAQATAYGKHGLDPDLQGLDLKSAAAVIACAILPDGAFLFLRGDPARLSPGLAKSLVEQMRGALGS